MPEPIFAVEYLRPDGWWEAGRGWEEREAAEVDAHEQFGPDVKWRVVQAPDQPREGVVE